MSIEDLDDVIAWLADKESALLADLERVQKDKDAVLHVRHLLPQWQVASAEGGGNEAESHSHISPRDIAECKSIKEANIKIACRSGGSLRYRIAAKLLMAAGVSTSKSTNQLAGDLRKRLTQDPDWEHSAPGTFRYLPYPEVGTEKGQLRKPSGLTPVSTAHVRPSPAFSPGGAGPS